MQVLSFIVVGLLISISNGQKDKSKPSVNYLLNQHEDDESRSGTATGPSSFQFTGPNGNRPQVQSVSRFPINNFGDYDGGLSGQFGNRPFSPSQFGNGQSLGGSNIDYDDYPLVTVDSTRNFGDQGFQGGFTPTGGFRGSFSPPGGFQDNFLPTGGFSNGAGFDMSPQNGGRFGMNPQNGLGMFPQNGVGQFNFPQNGGGMNVPGFNFPQNGVGFQQGFPGNNQGFPNQGFSNQGFSNQGFPNQGLPNQGFPNQGFPNQGFSNQGFSNQGFPNQGFQGFNGGFPAQGFNGRFPGGNQNNFGQNSFNSNPNGFGVRSRQTDPDYDDFDNSLTPSWQNQISAFNPNNRFLKSGSSMDQSRLFPAQFGRNRLASSQLPYDDIVRSSRNGRSDKTTKKTAEDGKDNKATKAKGQ